MEDPNQYQNQLNQLNQIPLVNSMTNFYKANPTRAILLGLGVVVLAPTVVPLLKPIAKATIKTGVSLYQKSVGAIAETGEVIGDLVAEAKAEVQAEQEQAATMIAATPTYKNPVS